MQRGILRLTRDQLLLAFQLAQSSNLDLRRLSNKLEMAIDSMKEEDQVEVNEDEVESLLDTFPIPSEDEKDIYKQLRNKLLIFLARKNG